VKSDNRLENLQYATASERIRGVQVDVPKHVVHRESEFFDRQTDVKEIWAEVPTSLTGQHVNAYQVSNHGEIRRNGRILDTTPNAGNYTRAAFSVDDQVYYSMVHRVVATAFIANPYNLPFVDHIDFNPLNNRVDNLQWISARGNAERSLAKKVSCYDPMTKQTVYFDSVIKAANEDPSKAAAIARACRGDDNRTQYNGLYWWYPEENARGLHDIEEEVELRRQAADKSRYEYKVPVQQSELQAICMLHISTPELCNFTSTFNLKQSIRCQSYEENGVRWIAMLHYPGYEISEKSDVRDIRSKELRQVTADGKVKLFTGPNQEFRVVRNLFQQHFGLKQDSDAPSELWKHCQVSMNHCISNLGRVFNCVDLKLYEDVNDGKSARDIRLNDKKTRLKLYKAVAALFLPKKEDETDAIVHIDGNIHNDAVSNLRRRKLAEKQRDIKADAKTTAEPVLQIDPATNQVVCEHASNRAAAESLGLTPTVISRAKGSGKIYKGFIWKTKPQV